MWESKSERWNDEDTELKVILMIYDISVCRIHCSNHFNELSKCLDKFEFIEKHFESIARDVGWEATQNRWMLVFFDSAYLPLALTYHHRILCMHPWILYGNIKRINIEQQMLQCQRTDNLQRIEFHCVVSQTVIVCVCARNIAWFLRVRIWYLFFFFCCFRCCFSFYPHLHFSIVRCHLFCSFIYKQESTDKPRQKKKKQLHGALQL